MQIGLNPKKELKRCQGLV